MEPYPSAQVTSPGKQDSTYSKSNIRNAVTKRQVLSWLLPHKMLYSLCNLPVMPRSKSPPKHLWWRYNCKFGMIYDRRREIYVSDYSKMGYFIRFDTMIKTCKLCSIHLHLKYNICFLKLLKRCENEKFNMIQVFDIITRSYLILLKPRIEIESYICVLRASSSL